jgi:hypothetical protein
MIIYIISLSVISSLSLLIGYMYYNSYKDMYNNNDINEYLLSSIYEYDNEYD